MISFLFELALPVLPRSVFSHGVQEILLSQPSHWVEHTTRASGNHVFILYNRAPTHCMDLIAVPIKVPVAQIKGSKARTWKVWGTGSSHHE